ncbi:disease resistance protein RUN1 [Quercus suber]|uniref:disease resistance protein RUN1 n=1 Tax=Quercus suber TaxID=58331 RepID=UPI0032DF622E
MLTVRPAVDFLVHDPDRCSDSRYDSFCSMCMRKPRKYDVFLSFYGEDTRKNFTDHLYTSLKQKGINAYRDNEKLEQGTPIASGLMKAIEESKYAIIFISENYAFSKCCLKELVKILECMKDKGLRVLPVFYHVNPSDVGNQRSLLRKRSLSIKKTRSYESEDIQEITKNIFGELNHEFPDFSEHLVGIHSRMMEMMNLFGTMPDDVHYIGIWGIPGIGKTTLAYVIYNRIRHQFEASSFICNVRETVEKHGLVYLQMQLVSETLKVKEVKIWNNRQGIKVIKKGLLNKKVLIVIDDADKDEQLQALVGNRDWFGLGSRIIITSKDKHLLERHHVVTIHKVNGLDNDEALELFSWTVFNQTYPKKEFVDLSNDYLKYAEGLPLALKVLGSSLIGRPRKEWEDYLHQLEEIPEGEILDKLEISKRGLNDTKQNLFLDKNRVAHMESFGCYKNIETLKDAFHVLNNDNVSGLVYINLENCAFV